MRQWRGPGLPLLVIPLAVVPFGRDPGALLRLGERLREGLVEGVPVRLDRLEAFTELASWETLPPLPTAAAPTAHSRPPLLLQSTSQQPLTIQQEQELEDAPLPTLADRLWSSTSLPEQAEVL